MRDYLNYGQILDEAMQSLIKNVLEKVSQYGLYDEHHLYISFITSDSGVELSSRMMRMYPHQITIVLQHQYSDLKIYQDKFSVKLSFNGIIETIVVPFKSITSFADPGANFAIHTQVGKKALDKVLSLDVDDLQKNAQLDQKPQIESASKGSTKKKDSVAKPKGRIIKFDDIKARALQKEQK